MRAAAAHPCLRSLAEATQLSEGDAQLWVATLQGIGHTLAGSSGCAPALAHAWPLLLAHCPARSSWTALPQFSSRAAADGLPQWSGPLGLACAIAGAVLDDVDDGHARGALRRAVEKLLTCLKQQLLSSSEPQRIAAGAALGQLRGGETLRMLLVELGLILDAQAAESEWSKSVTNKDSHCHTNMRALTQLFALVSEQDDWPHLLVTCGAPLTGFAHFTLGAIEYLTAEANVFAWSLQRARKSFLDVLAHTTPALLSTLAAQGSPLPALPVLLRPGRVLDFVATLLERSCASGFGTALEAERGRLLKRAAVADLPSLEPMVTEELRLQAEAVQIAGLARGMLRVALGQDTPRCPT